MKRELNYIIERLTKLKKCVFPHSFMPFGTVGKGNIIKNGVRERLVIPEVSTTQGPSCSVTLSPAQSELWVGTIESPCDLIPLINNNIDIFGNKSIHRFNGEVKIRQDMPVFIGSGSKENRLSFLLLKGIGYVYIRGYGAIVYPDGRRIELGKN